MEVRVLPKTFLGVSAQRQQTAYDKAAVFLGASLQYELNRTTTGDVLNVGSTSASITAATLTPVAISGTGGTLTLTGTGNLVVRQGNATAGAHMATAGFRR